MLERIDDMPRGTIGFRTTGEITRDDYRDILEPALRDQAEAGDVRLVYVIDGAFGVTGGAMLEDVKTGAQIGIGHHSAWKRFALVTDVDWIARAARMFSWATPGQVKVFGLDELESAKTWVAG